MALALVADAPLYEIAIACEVFGLPRTDLADPWYDFRICLGRHAEPTEFGFIHQSPFGLDGLADADTLVVPALPYACVDTEASIPSDLIDAIRRAHAAGTRVVSLCSGAFALAEAGLLDGRRAATHWMHADTLTARYPRVNVDASVLYVDEGDILTSAGRSAALDLCLHVVRSDLGASVANQVARRMVVAAHRSGGQAQYVDLAVPATTDDGLSATLEWALANLDTPLTINDLASHANVSPRTLIRRFQAALGTTPNRWLLDQRVLRARMLLESTDLPMDAVSSRSGLGSSANLRHHFGLHLGITPSAYRTAFLRGNRATWVPPRERGMHQFAP
ncbi:MAG: helix-turn-helix domain-containing protein [Acidimicrobiales bacterium]